MSGSSGSRTAGQAIAFVIFAVPLLLLGVWVWSETPERDGAGGPVAGGGPAETETESAAGALEIELSRPRAGELRVTFANVSERKITIVVPGRPGGVLRLVNRGDPHGPPRALSHRPGRDAVVELLPGAAYNQTYRGPFGPGRGPLEAIYDSRGPGLPAAAWRGIARSSASEEAGGDEEDTNGG